MKIALSFLDSGEELDEVSFEAALVGRRQESERFHSGSNFHTERIYCRNRTGYQMWPRIEEIDRRKFYTRQICLKVFVAEIASNSLRPGVWTTHSCEESTFLLWPPSLSFLFNTMSNGDS